MKKIIISMLAVLLVLTACNPNGGMSLPEGTPDEKGTFEEYLAWYSDMANEPIPESEGLNQIMQLLQLCILTEHQEAVDGTITTDGTYQFVGKNGDADGIPVAFYGEMTMHYADGNINVNGRLAFADFVFSITGNMYEDGINVKINGKNYSATVTSEY